MFGRRVIVIFYGNTGLALSAICRFIVSQILSIYIFLRCKMLDMGLSVSERDN